MTQATKAGGKFTIETTIRDKDGNIKSHTIEEGMTLPFCRHQQNDKHEAEEKEKALKKGGTPTAIAEFRIKMDRDLSQRLRKEIDKEEKEGRIGIRRIK